MARHAKGWTLRRRRPGGVYLVRFSHGGRLIERSTGCGDRLLAETAAARIYASVITRAPGRRSHRSAGSLEEAVARWIVSLTATHDPGTVATWKLYARAHWLSRWGWMHEITRSTVEQYRDERLGVVLATTVRKELSALRVFLRWAEVDVPVPSVGKRTLGQRYAVARRGTAPQLSPEDVAAILDALPERSTSRKVPTFPIRARFVVAYETSLRPSTLDRLRVPTHYRKGAASLLLTPDVDKGRHGREVPLSRRAREALDAVCPAEGLIFGAHDYREHLDAAARTVLPPETAERFCAAHFRSARITHLLEQTGNLPGVQHLAGHKLAATTSLYAKPSLRAALDVIAASDLGMPKNRPAGRLGGKRRSG